MGWVRGETYMDTYAPLLPKTAILGAHGYKAHEVYDPVWRHIHVPEQFLMLMCLMAEEHHEKIVMSGKSFLYLNLLCWSDTRNVRSPKSRWCCQPLVSHYETSTLLISGKIKMPNHIFMRADSEST